jgi:DNA-binding NtrC family response regulator
LQKLLKTVEQALEKAPPKELFAVETKAEIKADGSVQVSSKIEEFIVEEAGSNQAEFNLSYIDLPLREARDLFEKAYFEYHLNQASGSMTRVAEKTGLERTHLYRKLKALGIDVSNYKGE